MNSYWRFHTFHSNTRLLEDSLNLDSQIIQETQYSALLNTTQDLRPRTYISTFRGLFSALLKNA